MHDDGCGCFIAVILIVIVGVCGADLWDQGFRERQLVAFEEARVASEKDPAQHRRIDNIVRVMMHKPSEYTLYEKRENVLVPHFIQGSFTLVADVSPGEPMWVDYYYVKGKRSTTNAEPIYATVHIHSEKDLQGGGWQERVGKFGVEKGDTIIVD